MQLELRGISLEGSLREALAYSIEHRGHRAEATQAQQQDHCRWLIDWWSSRCQHEPQLSDVTYPMVAKYIESEGPNGRGLAFASLKKRLVTLRLAIEDAYGRGLIERKPDWWPTVRDDGVPNERFWPYDMYRQGRLAFPEEQRIGIDIMFWTGMHISDVRRWRRSDVRKGEWLRYNTKSRAQPRWLPLPTEFEEILTDWFAKHGLVSNEIIAPDLWVSPVKAYARVCARAEVQRCTPNSLRASCVSYMAERGIDMEIVALWLGHQRSPLTSEVIRRHYHKFPPSTLRSAIGKLNR